MNDRIKIVQRNFLSAWKCVPLRNMISQFIRLLNKHHDFTPLQNIMNNNSEEVDCSSKQELLERNLLGLYLWLKFEYEPTFAQPEAPTNLKYDGETLKFFNMNPVSCKGKIPPFYEFRVLNLTMDTFLKIRNFSEAVVLLLDDPEPNVSKIYVQYLVGVKDENTTDREFQNILDKKIEKVQSIFAEYNIIVMSDPILHHKIEYYCWGFITRNLEEHESNSLFIKQISFDCDAYIHRTDFCLDPHVLQIVLFHVMFQHFSELDYKYIHIEPDILTKPIIFKSESIERKNLLKSKPELALLRDFKMTDRGPVSTYKNDLDFETNFVMEELGEFEFKIIAKNRYLSVILENVIQYVKQAKYIRGIHKSVVQSIGQLNTKHLKENSSKFTEYKKYRIILNEDFKFEEVKNWEGAGDIVTQWNQMKSFVAKYFEIDPSHRSVYTSLISPLGDQVYHLISPEDLGEINIKNICSEYGFPITHMSSPFGRFSTNICIYTQNVDETDFVDKLQTFLNNSGKNVNVFTHVGMNVFLSCSMTKKNTSCVVESMCIDMDSLHTPWIREIPLLTLLSNVIYDEIIPFFIKLQDTNTVLFEERTLELFEDIKNFKELKNNAGQYVFQILETKEKFVERYQKLYKPTIDINDIMKNLSLTESDTESDKKKGKKKIAPKQAEKQPKEEQAKEEQAKEEQAEKKPKKEQAEKKPKEEQPEKQSKEEQPEKQSKEEQPEKQSKEEQPQKVKKHLQNTQTDTEWEDEFITKGFEMGYEACSKDLMKNKNNVSTNTDKVTTSDQKTQIRQKGTSQSVQTAVAQSNIDVSAQTNVRTFETGTQTENFIEKYNRQAREKNTLQIDPYLPIFAINVGEKSDETSNFPLEIQGSTYFFQNISRNSVLWNMLTYNPDHVKWLYMHGSEELLKSLSKPILQQPRNTDDILKIFLSK